MTFCNARFRFRRCNGFNDCRSHSELVLDIHPVTQIRFRRERAGGLPPKAVKLMATITDSLASDLSECNVV